MLIDIQLADGTIGQADDSLLVKTESVVDNENEYTTAVEYRFIGSDKIVHRSVHVTLKKWPEGMSGAVQDLT